MVLVFKDYEKYLKHEKAVDNIDVTNSFDKEKYIKDWKSEDWAFFSGFLESW